MTTVLRRCVLVNSHLCKSTLRTARGRVLPYRTVYSCYTQKGFHGNHHPISFYTQIISRSHSSHDSNRIIILITNHHHHNHIIHSFIHSFIDYFIQTNKQTNKHILLGRTANECFCNAVISNQQISRTHIPLLRHHHKK